MKYLLDTDTCIYSMNEKPGINDKLAFFSDDDLALSCFTLAELYFGAYNSKRIDKNLQRVRSLVQPLRVLNFDNAAEQFFGSIKAELKRHGELMNDFDLGIAAIALSNKLILVTNNEKHFDRIPELRIENWIK